MCPTTARHRGRDEADSAQDMAVDGSKGGGEHTLLVGAHDGQDGDEILADIAGWVSSRRFLWLRRRLTVVLKTMWKVVKVSGGRKTE